MRVRHIALFLLAALAMAAGLVGCDLLGMVSIDQRITDFQTDLNMTDRTSAYLNFHPTLTQDYSALKDGSTITTYFPAPGGTGSAYALTVTDQTNTAAVLVTVTGGPMSFGSTHYLQLDMSTTGVSDYRIVTLEISTSTTFTGTPQIK